MAEELNLTQILQGSGSLIFVSITALIGIIIISKFFKYKNNTFLMIGIAWIGITFGWVPDVINFILYLTGNPFLPDTVYLTIVFAFLPWFVLLWIAGLSKLLSFKKKSIIILVFFIIALILDIAFFILLFMDTDYIGTQVGPFHYNFSDFTVILSISLLAIVLITGIKFAYESLKSDEKAIRLKGKFLILAFLLFTAGAVLETMFSTDLTEITVVLVRVLLVSSSISFYLGFILPDWAKKLLLKNK